jgi:hypothetical protein
MLNPTEYRARSRQSATAPHHDSTHLYASLGLTAAGAAGGLGFGATCTAALELASFARRHAAATLVGLGLGLQLRVGVRLGVRDRVRVRVRARVRVRVRGHLGDALLQLGALLLAYSLGLDGRRQQNERRCAGTGAPQRPLFGTHTHAARALLSLLSGREGGPEQAGLHRAGLWSRWWPHGRLRASWPL